MSKALKGFITYSHEDTEAKHELPQKLFLHWCPYPCSHRCQFSGPGEIGITEIFS